MSKNMLPQGFEFFKKRFIHKGKCGAVTKQRSIINVIIE